MDAIGTGATGPPTTSTVTLLFSDIEGSTRLLQRLGGAYTDLLEAHHAIIRESVRECNGHDVDAAGDGFFLVFAAARDAVAAAVMAQRRLQAAAWPQDVQVRVRMGLHTGEPTLGGIGYVGLDVHRAARISAAAHGGQVLLSTSTRDLMGNDVPDGVTIRDLGPHRLKDLHEPEHLFQLDIAGLQCEFPRIGGSTERLHNFTTVPTPLIGREEEVDEVLSLIARPTVRAVTLTGPGGSGKTRLAMAAAEAAATSFENGAWFVPLATVREAEFVGPTIARTLGIAERPSATALECLTASLGSQPTLLLLDNFEQVTDAAPLIADLLGNCPGLKVLVTSRGVLRIRGEHECAVAPLAVPDRRHWHDPGSLAASPAVALFVDRARAVRPEFELSDRNAPAVAEICARLDGLPLALELAAARIRLFPPEALLSRLGRRLDLLRGGARDLPERHRALRQTIAWSHELLEPAERQLFHRIAVFNGGFSLDAAEHVSAAAGPPDIAVLDAIVALVDRGLLRGDDESDDEVRFTMLGTIRDFGAEQLEAAGEAAPVRRAHALYFTELAERARAHLSGAEATIWLDRLERDHDNLEAALAWAIDTGDREIAQRLAAALWRFWIIRGHMREGRERFERVYDLGGEPSASRAWLLHGYGTLTHELSDYDLARALLQEELDVWHTLGDEAGIARATTGLGWVAGMNGDFRTANHLSNEALRGYRALGDENGETLALHQIGWFHALEGNIREAIDITEDVLARRARRRDRRALAFTQSNLGYMLTQAGEYDRATALLDEAFVTLNILGDRQISAWNLSQQSRLAWATGDPIRAMALMEEALDRWREVGNMFGLADSLTLQTTIALDLDRSEEAAALIEKAARAWKTNRAKTADMALACNRARLALRQGERLSAIRNLLLCVEKSALIGNALDGPEALELLASIAREVNDVAAAALFLAAALHRRRRQGTPVPLCRRERIGELKSWCRAAGLDYETGSTNDDVVERAVTEARRLTDE